MGDFHFFYRTLPRELSSVDNLRAGFLKTSQEAPLRFVLLKKYLHHYLLSKLLLFTLTHLFPVWFILTYLNFFF